MPKLKSGKLIRKCTIGHNLEFRGELASDLEINTKLPLGNEPLSNPANNLSFSTYDLPYAENREPSIVYIGIPRFYATMKPL